MVSQAKEERAAVAASTKHKNYPSYWSWIEKEEPTFQSSQREGSDCAVIP